MIIKTFKARTATIIIFALIFICCAGYFTAAFCAGKVLNVATVRYRDAHGNVCNPVSASAETPISDGPNIKVSVYSDSEIAAIGSVVTYKITYENSGNLNATQLKIDSIISRYVVFNEASGGGIFDPDKNIISWIIPAIKPGEKGILTIKTTVKKPSDFNIDDPEKIKNGVKIINTVKSETKEQKLEDVFVITVGEAPLLKISVNQSATALKPGEYLKYTIQFENAGNAVATNVSVKNEIPELTSYVEGSITDPAPINRLATQASPPPAGTGRIEGRTILWNVGTLNANQAQIVTFQVRLSPIAPAGRQIFDTAVILGSEQSATSSNQTVTDIINDYSAAITLSASSERVAAGDNVDYIITITNNGNTSLTNPVIKSQLASNVIFISSDNGGRLAGSSIVWTMPALTPGAGKILRFQVRVANQVASGDFITGKASLNAPELTDVLEAVSRIPVVDINAASDLKISMTSNKNAVFIGETVRFTIPVENNGTSMVSGVKLHDALPAGLNFVTGSAVLDGQKIADPQILPGGRLIWPIRDMAQGTTFTLNFTARAGAGITDKNTVNSAFVDGNYLGRTISSKTASVKLKVAEGVFSSNGIILGKVFFDIDRNGIQNAAESGIEGAKLLLEDGTYVETDCNGKFSIYNVAQGTHVLRLDVSSLSAGLEPAPVSSRNCGNGESIFVDLGQSMIFTANFAVTGNSTALKTSANKTKSLKTDTKQKVLTTQQTQPAKAASDQPEPGYLKNIASMTPALDFVNLKNNEVIFTNTLTIAAKAPKNETVKLFVNGIQIGPERIGRKSVANGVTVYEFIGTALRPGEKNLLKLTATDSYGNIRASKEITIKTSGEPEKISAKAEKNYAPADGKSLSKIFVKFYDREGNRVTYPTKVTAGCNIGEIKNPDEDQALPGTQITISDGSSAVIILSPRETGKAIVAISYNGMEASADLNFVPELKPPVTVGIGEFVIGKQKDYLTAGTYRDARGAFFTKGKLGRDMQLTMSYDSHKIRRDELFRQSYTDLNSEDKYPIFGDESLPGYETTSREKLYLRLDRKMSTLLYGDYYTDLSENKLTAYNRMFNGAKLVINERRATLNSFVSYANNTQIVDKFRGRGISGYYNLSNTRITPGSEFVVIETRYRFQPDVVIKRETKVREQDYTIDYDLGFILFKSEIPSSDNGFNPVFLIVSYEAESLDEKYYIYGGRNSIKLGRIAELGITGITEKQIAGDHRISGIDLSFKAKRNSLKLELAKTGSMTMIDNVLSAADGKGFSAELTGNPISRLTYKGYFKTAGDYFNNPSAYDIMPGTKRLSFDASYKLDKKFRLRGSYFKQNDMLNSMYYEHAAIGAEKTFDKTKLSLDIVKEKSSDSFVPISQLRTRHPFDISEQTPDDLTAADINIERPLNRQISVSARSKFDILHNNYNISMAGIDYKLANAAKLYLRGERAKFEDITDHRMILGAESDLLKNTTAFSEYRLGDGSAGERLQKSIGLRNRFKLGPKVTGNFSIEKLNTLKGPELLLEPDALAFTTGLEYLPMDKLKITGRFEKRKASIEDSYLSELASAYGINRNTSLLFRSRLFRNWQTALGKSSSLRTSLGLAFRPVYFDGFNALLRLELKENLNPSALNGFDDNAIIYSLESAYRTCPKIQVAGKYAAKKDRNAAFGGITDLTAGKLTLDISERFDFSVEYRVMDSRASKTKVSGGQFEFGYRVKDDIWLSAGHSTQKFDSDLTGDSFEGKGPYAKLRFKFDENILQRRK